MMSLLNVGIIGTGSRARSHIPVILKLCDIYKLVAVCDIDEARVKKVAEETKAKPYTDIEKMLNKEELDVCLISIQAEGHHIVAKVLAERGIHILTETPLAITVACAEQMIRAAKDNGVLLEVSENVPRWPHERLKQKIVADGLLGDVKEFYLSYTSGSYHGIAGIRKILNSEGESVLGEFPSETSVLERAQISFTNNVRGIYEFNRNRGNYWEIVGTKGAIMGEHLQLFEGDRRITSEIKYEEAEISGKKRVVGAKVETQPKVMVRGSPEWFQADSYDELALADAWMSLYNAAVDGRPLTYGAENARRDLELLMAIRDSETRGGIRIDLPLRDITEYERLVHKEFAMIYGSDPLDSNLYQLKAKYALPGSLREMMYYGRVIK
jgi:predicted dehydrogenase